MRSRSTGMLLGLLCTIYFIAYVDRVNIGMASTVFGPAFHLSHTQIGAAIGAFGWTYLIFQILGGVWGDKWGARRTLAVCGLVVGLATISIGLAQGLSTIIIARIVLGAGEGAMFPVASRAIAQSLPAAMRARAQGMTHAFGRLANAVTPAIVTSLILWGSWRTSFTVIGAVSVLWALIWFFVYRDQPYRRTAGSVAAIDASAGIGTKSTAEETRSLTTRSGHAAPQPSAQALNQLTHPGHISKKTPWWPLIRRIAPLSMVYFCYGWVFWLFLSWIPQYFVHSQKVDIKHSAIFSSGVFLAGVAGDLVGGWLSDTLFKRTGSLLVARRYLIAGALLCALLCMLPMLFTANTLWIGLCLSGALFFCEVIIGPIWALPMDITPEYASTATGMMSAGATIAGILSPIAAGMIIDQTHDWTLPFVVAIGVLILGVLLALRIRPEQGLQPRSIVAPTGVPQ